MSNDAMLGELEQLAQKLDVAVVYDRFTGDAASGGGLCRVKGQWRVLIERRGSATEKASTLARALARFDTEAHFVSPSVRELIERYRAPG